MQRAQKMKTPDGVAAWLVYCTWLRSMGKQVPPQASFISSRFYQSFIKFAEFVKQVKNINVDKFVPEMVKLGISPVIWTNDIVYSEWMRSSTAEKSPLKLVQQTALFVMDHAERNGFEVSELFDHITATEFVSWLDEYRISLWFMFGSAKFKNWLKSLESEQQSYLCTRFSISEWMDKLRTNPNTMVTIKQIVVELGL